MQVPIETIQTHHLVKSEDLNHHGTLYAGRAAEWLVESGFIAAAHLVPPENVVCMQIHGMTFSRPVHLGEVICYESKVVLTGRSRIVAHVMVSIRGEPIVEGFITFVNVDKDGKAFPHGVEMLAEKPEDVALQERAKALPVR